MFVWRSNTEDAALKKSKSKLEADEDKKEQVCYLGSPGMRQGQDLISDIYQFSVTCESSM